MSFRFDATLKEMVRVTARDYAAFVGMANPAAARLLNVDLSTLSMATDAAIAIGDPPTEIADLNFQSGHDLTLPECLLLYNAALRYRYGVHVRSVVLLLTSKADHQRLAGVLATGDERHRLEFSYEVIRVWQKPPETFLNGPLGLVPLAILGDFGDDDDPEAAAARILDAIDKRIRSEAGSGKFTLLRTAASILIGLRFNKESLTRVLQKGTKMEVEEEYTTLFDVAKEMAQLEAMRKAVEIVGEQKFGPPTPAVTQRLDKLADPLRNEALKDVVRVLSSVGTASTWDELLPA